MLKKIITIVVSVIIVLAIGVGGWFLDVWNDSKGHNLIKVKAHDLPIKQEKVEDDYIQLSEVRMHYVRYGSGKQPVILIHGNGGSCDSLKELAQYLSNDYSVYCLDSRCQGKSSDPDEITYDLMAKDVYEFIQAKLTVKPFIVGHSDGGIVAISLASLYPDSVGAMIPCGANSHPDKFRTFFTVGVKFVNFFKETKLNALMLNYPDFTPEYLARITAPTYILAGVFDIVRVEDTVYLNENIAGSKMAIISGADHSSYISKSGGQIYMIASEFFAEQPQCVPLGK